LGALHKNDKKGHESLAERTDLRRRSLLTLMCEVESIINGRPITKVSDDSKDSEALTPNHLLLLRTGPTLPPVRFQKEDLYSRRRWRQVQYLADVFWRRWLKEYLPSLQRQEKWNQARRNFEVGDVVNSSRRLSTQLLASDSNCPSTPKLH
jgi:hypothetical protein